MAADMAAEEAEVSGVAGRYAAALFDLAKEAGRIDEIAKDLASIDRALSESRDLTRLVRSPAIPAGDQSRALGAVLARMGADPLTSKFIALITRNRRLFVLKDILADFDTLVRKHRNQVSAQVISAHALDDSQVEALKATLKDITDRDVTLSLKVDPAILGGLIVRVGSRMVDSSLKTRLNNLKLAMKEVR